MLPFIVSTPVTDFWQPTTILRYIDSRESSTQVILVKTDLGDGYLKAMGNPEGEHVLACEWVGTQLARWFGLPTFRFGTVMVAADDELTFHRREKGRAKPGPAFISKADPGEPWGGTKRQLKRLANPGDVSRLVVFDTWIRNQDRYFVRPDNSIRRNTNNVFLSEDAPEGRFLLRAMDHSHAFPNGREIVARNLGPAQARDPTVYGLFPEFRPFLDRDVVRRAADRLRQMDATAAARVVDTIPREWDVSPDGRRTMTEFIGTRAEYLSAEVGPAQAARPRIMAMLWPQGELFPSGEPGTEV